METALSEDSEAMLLPRAYQLEMLEESLKRNIIVAMDTGSGKTNMHVLRVVMLESRSDFVKELSYESRQSSSMLVWLLCPTVALVEQQYNVISAQLPSFQSRHLSGNDGIDRWSEQSMWDDALRNMNIIVCTHQVLLDALIHGFVHMEKIALLVFDEAHHCARGHPANKIMQNFYHAMRQEGQQELPSILGLTASPVARKKGEGLQKIEQNLNAISKTPKRNREELQRFVHRPKMVVLLHVDEQIQPSRLLQDLSQLYSNLDIEQDPYVTCVREQHFEEYLRVRLSRKTYCQNQIKRLVRTATEINHELGPWTSELYICLCIIKFRAQRQVACSILEDIDESEKVYLNTLFTSLPAPAIDLHLNLQDRGLSLKVRQLIGLLANEMSPGSAGIVFVKTRATVKLLSVLLTTHPMFKDVLQIGTFVGASNNQARSSNISDLINISDQIHTLDDLRKGTKNLIIATSVCEEGIDIAACNLVICFEPPPNLKSFVQRRGRARSVKSKFVVMFPEGQEKALQEWQELEAEMKEKYMDDMRHLEIIEEAEAQEEGYREFLVESTGAKITLPDALQHLYHFCNTLPATPYTVLAPIFTFEHMVSTKVSCKVILPNTVHSSVREFRSTDTWFTEKWARMDAAFEAYVGLYHAGLVNGNLLPSPNYDKDVAKAYAEVAKRPAVANINAKYDPWPAVAAAWQSTLTLYPSIIRILSGAREILRMKMIAPCQLPQLSDLTLYVDSKTVLHVKIDSEIGRTRKEINVTTANKITDVLLTSVFPSKMERDDGGFPLLFTPAEDVDDLENWLEHVQGTYDLSHMLSAAEDTTTVGIVRDHSKSGKAYVFHGFEQLGEDSSPQQQPEVRAEMHLKVKKFPKRTDFLHRIPAEAMEKKDDFVFLDPGCCQIHRLPTIYSQFAMYIPSIMHHVENALLTDHLRNGILAPIGFSGPNAVFPAICGPAAREVDDYQRLEFLGDSILKMLTSTTLMADHQTWHEGYLSRAKDHVVSNGRLAMAAQETTLDKYILTKSFTGKKWRPLSNIRLDNPRTFQQRNVSTKILADVVEAVIGAAFLDGGFAKALSCLRLFLPEISWLPLAKRNNMLRDTYDLPQLSTTPLNFGVLKTLVGHTFTREHFLLEAVTHPSHLSIPSTPSYQRLEYLGDAILDYLVTTIIFSHGDPSQQALQPRRMHTLRATAVNASFLAFCSLSHTLSIPIAEIPSPRPNEAPSLVPGARPTSLPDFLRHAPIPTLASVLKATRTRFAAVKSAVDIAFAHSHVYPWRALAAFAPEKVFSDLIEATLGAVYIDTSGDLKVCEALLRRFGILGWLEMALKTEANIWHPKEELGFLAKNAKVRYLVWIEEMMDKFTLQAGDLVKPREEKISFGKGKYRCKLFVGEREVCSVQGWNRTEVETAAAEEAVRILGAE